MKISLQIATPKQPLAKTFRPSWFSFNKQLKLTERATQRLI